MSSFLFLALKSLLPYRGVAQVPLPEGLICFEIVSLHELKWLLAFHQKRSLITLVHLVLARYAIHQNGIFEALRHGTHYVIWPIPEGVPNDKRLVQFFIRFHKVQ